MIYAKETPKNARAILGADVYDSISAKKGIEGGLGHKLYEQWRSLPDNDTRRRLPIETQSKAYYDSIRSKAGQSAINSVGVTGVFSQNVVKHSDFGDFSKPANPKKNPNPSSMVGGGMARQT